MYVKNEKYKCFVHHYLSNIVAIFDNMVYILTQTTSNQRQLTLTEDFYR